LNNDYFVDRRKLANQIQKQVVEPTKIKPESKEDTFPIILWELRRKSIL
jgi:hypothetical protein